MPQTVDSGRPIGLPFEPCQPRDKTLRWPMAPDERPPGAHGRFILAPSLHEGSSLLHTDLLHRCAPGIQLVASTLTDHAAEGLGLVLRAGHHRVKVEATCEEGLIARALVFRVRQT
jgi:hypothetical protein